jgi:hypothetical protein
LIACTQGPNGETDDNEFEAIPDSQLTVSRIAYRNNSSKYLLDDKVRAKSL